MNDLERKETVLTERERKLFLDALENPAAPTDALRKAFELHNQMVINED